MEAFGHFHTGTGTSAVAYQGGSWLGLPPHHSGRGFEFSIFPEHVDAQFSPSVIGPKVFSMTCKSHANEGRWTERHLVFLEYCVRLGLIVADTFGQGGLLWTRCSLTKPFRFSCLDHVLSDYRCVASWNPLVVHKSHDKFLKKWGDHRPCNFIVHEEGGTTKRKVIAAYRRPVSYTGWSPKTSHDALDFCRKLTSWSCLDTHFHNVTTLCDSLLAHALDVPFTTSAQRRRAICERPHDLANIRDALKQPLNSDEERRRRRRRERAALARWHTRQFDIMGGIVGAKRIDEYKPVSLVHCFGELTGDRKAWQKMLIEHWADRFHDPLDAPDAQARFYREKSRQTDGSAHTVLSFGSYVIALAHAKCGTAGGPDGLVNEMLRSAPWHFHMMNYCLLNMRFEDRDEAGARHDLLKNFRVSWIRKDCEGVDLSSFRPICSGSIESKQYIRMLLGPAPFAWIVPLLPLWGFRPRLSAQMLTTMLNVLVNTNLQLDNSATPASYDLCILQLDVESVR